MEQLNVGLYTQVSKSGVKYLYGNYNFLGLFKIHFTIFSNAQYKKEKKNNKIPDMRMLVKLEKIKDTNKQNNPLESIMNEVFNNQGFTEEIEQDELPFDVSQEPKQKATNNA